MRKNAWKIGTRTTNTLIHEWNVRAFHCSMDRFDDNDEKKEPKKKYYIQELNSQQSECYCYLCMCCRLWMSVHFQYFVLSLNG